MLTLYLEIDEAVQLDGENIEQRLKELVIKDSHARIVCQIMKVKVGGRARGCV